MQYLPLAVVAAAARASRRRGVSQVARSPRGFYPRYRAAGGRSEKLSDYWSRRRDGFVARHVAQLRANREPLFDRDGRPTRRHLALAVWAYSPAPVRLARWLIEQGYLTQRR